MTFIVGTLSLIQVLFLPGVLLLRLLNIRTGVFHTLIFSFAFSLLFNYVLMQVFMVLGIYTRPYILGLFGVELISGIFLYRREVLRGFRLSLDDVSHSLTEKCIASVSEFIKIAPNTSSVEYGRMEKLYRIVALAGAAGAVGWAIWLLVHNAGSVFMMWDAVVSWNRWATSLYHQTVALESWHYPQLLPANWSMTYLFLGCELQFFAKGIMPLFALGIVLLLIRLGLKNKAPAFLYGSALSVFFLRNALGDQFIADGYSDIAVAFWVVLVLYCLLILNREDSAEAVRGFIILGGFAAIGGACTKQAGLFLFGIYPLLAWAIVFHKKTERQTINPRKLLCVLFLIGIVLIAPFYTYKQILICQGIESSEIQTCTSTIHGNKTMLQRLTTGLALLRSEAGRNLGTESLVLVGILWGLSFRKRELRWINLGIVVPYTLIWGFLFSYDIRNATLVFPLLSIGIGHGIDGLFSSMKPVWERLLKIKVIFVLASVAVLLFIANFYWFPPSVMVTSQKTQQRNILIPTLNERLYASIHTNPLRGKILSNYPLRFLPDFEDYHVFSYTKKYNDFKAIWAKHNDIRYLLVPYESDPLLLDEIKKNINEGKMRVLFEAEYWVFVEIL